MIRKLASGEYKSESPPCPVCTGGTDVLLAEKDRYGLPMRVVACDRCGLIRTDFARALWEDPKMLAQRNEATPLRRIGEPDEIAGAAVFLASPAATFMTGQSLVIDGGVTC
jgi:NAD(P)-dependent dehydrogenase (short-subunit alcohol dehydrogenase family)